MSNEAAERLRAWIDQSADLWTLPSQERRLGNEALDEALAAERRATVERIREALMHADGFRPDGKRRINAYNDDIEAILDEEAK